MLKIYIVRHGQDLDNFNGILNGHRNEPLTKKGIEQSNEIADKIKKIKITFTAVYNSPLKRAFETAKIISKIIASPLPQKEDLLIERNFGIMTGKRVSDVYLLCAPNIIKTRDITYFLNPEGAETFPDLINRAGTLLNKIKNKHKSGNILLICHGDIGKMIYAKYYNLDWKKVLNEFYFGNCDLLLLSENSIVKNSHIFNTKHLS